MGWTRLPSSWTPDVVKAPLLLAFWASGSMARAAPEAALSFRGSWADPVLNLSDGPGLWQVEPWSWGGNSDLITSHVCPHPCTPLSWPKRVFLDSIGG